MWRWRRVTIPTQAFAARASQGAVELTRETRFRTTVALPANLTEGAFAARVFLTRDGGVLGSFHTVIDLRNTGIVGWLAMFARTRRLAHGLLAVAVAVLAGRGASAAFRFLHG